jgi:uncharacterized protein (TIGR03067 family)
MFAKGSLSLLVVAMAMAMAVGAAPEAGGDLPKLQGRWETKVGLRKATVVALEIKGKAVAATIVTPQGGRIRADGELKLDETTTPKALDWVKFTTIDGEEVPEMRAIYRLEEGRLYIRSGGFNDDRPAGFDPGEGVWANVLVFQRPES